MNVEKEIAAANARIRVLVERRAAEALTRLGLEPAAAARENHLADSEARGYALGQAWKMLVDGMAAFAEGFRRGGAL